MAQTFHITPSVPYTQLDPTGTGRISFTITNASAKPVRAWPDLKPLGSTQRDWLQVEGQAERSFSPNEAHVFTVLVKTPPGTPAGKYDFKLNVINADKAALDGCTEGPTVQFEVQAAVPPPPPRKWLWIVAAVLLLLVCGAVFTALKMRNKDGGDEPPTELPHVVDQASAFGATVFPLLVRGGPALAVTSSPSGRPDLPVSLFVDFTRAPRGAAAPAVAQSGLEPGLGAWMDRAVGPNEPARIRLDVSEKDANALKKALKSPQVYYTFVCFNSGQGFMRSVGAQGQVAATP